LRAELLLLLLLLLSGCSDEVRMMSMNAQSVPSSWMPDAGSSSSSVRHVSSRSGKHADPD